MFWGGGFADVVGQGIEAAFELFNARFVFGGVGEDTADGGVLPGGFPSGGSPPKWGCWFWGLLVKSPFNLAISSVKGDHLPSKSFRLYRQRRIRPFAPLVQTQTPASTTPTFSIALTDITQPLRTRMGFFSVDAKESRVWAFSHLRCKSFGVAMALLS